MPKEKFNCDNQPDAVTQLEVSWHPGAWVQLATALRREVPASEEHPAYVTYESDAYVTFNRHGINRLIQTLRRARNAAFGRDE